MLAVICLVVLVWLGFIPKPAYLARLVSTHPTPEDIAPGWVYVVGGTSYQKWAYFRSPTDSGEIIQLSLMPNRRPCWQVNIDWLRRPTIHPSVRQLEDSYPHFWLRKGTIDWCPDTGQESFRGNVLA
jgi:hypothetical protein